MPKAPKRKRNSSRSNGEPPLPYCAAALDSGTKAGCVIGCGSTAWLSGHRTSVTLDPTCAAALGNSTQAGCVMEPSAMEKATIQNKIPRFPGNFCSVRQRTSVTLDPTCAAALGS